MLLLWDVMCDVSRSGESSSESGLGFLPLDLVAVSENSALQRHVYFIMGRQKKCRDAEYQEKKAISSYPAPKN